VALYLFEDPTKKNSGISYLKQKEFYGATGKIFRYRIFLKSNVLLHKNMYRIFLKSTVPLHKNMYRIFLKSNVPLHKNMKL